MRGHDPGQPHFHSCHVDHSCKFICSRPILLPASPPLCQLHHRWKLFDIVFDLLKCCSLQVNVLSAAPRPSAQSHLDNAPVNEPQKCMPSSSESCRFIRCNNSSPTLLPPPRSPTAGLKSPIIGSPFSSAPSHIHQHIAGRALPGQHH